MPRNISEREYIGFFRETSSVKYGCYTCILSKESTWVEGFDKKKSAKQETAAGGWRKSHNNNNNNNNNFY